jgi:hypothetical protein
MAPLWVARMAGFAPDTLDWMGPLLAKTWLSGYEPTRVVLCQLFCLALPHLRRASWTMALLHVAMVLNSGLAGLWVLSARFEDEGGRRPGVSVFLINLRRYYALRAFATLSFFFFGAQ